MVDCKLKIGYLGFGLSRKCRTNATSATESPFFERRLRIAAASGCFGSSIPNRSDGVVLWERGGEPSEEAQKNVAIRTTTAMSHGGVLICAAAGAPGTVGIGIFFPFDYT